MSELFYTLVALVFYVIAITMVIVGALLVYRVPDNKSNWHDEVLLKDEKTTYGKDKHTISYNYAPFYHFRHIWMWAGSVFPIIIGTVFLSKAW